MRQGKTDVVANIALARQVSSYGQLREAVVRGEAVLLVNNV